MRDIWTLVCRIRDDCFSGIPDARVALSPVFVSNVLAISEAAAVRLLTELVDLGYVEDDYSDLSDLGRALACANGLPRLARSEADKLVSRFLVALREHNDPESLCFIRSVQVFGSYLTDSPDVGDIDLIIHLDSAEPEDADDSSFGDYDDPFSELENLRAPLDRGAIGKRFLRR